MEKTDQSAMQTYTARQKKGRRARTEITFHLFPRQISSKQKDVEFLHSKSVFVSTV